jgi:competence protein ComEC
MVLLTHEDKDHVGGLPSVFSRYDIATFVRTENQGENIIADSIDSYAEDDGVEFVRARRGMEFDLGGGALLTILFPDRDPSFLESNTSSIVARLTYGDSEFLLTGDSPESIEKYLVGIDAANLRSDVLKLGHHGSRTSSSDIFLDAVRPGYAIVSAEKDSRYGHPHKEVVEAVRGRNVTLLSTAEKGSITFETDGQTLTLK